MLEVCGGCAHWGYLVPDRGQGKLLGLRVLLLLAAARSWLAYDTAACCSCSGLIRALPASLGSYRSWHAAQREASDWSPPRMPSVHSGCAACWVAVSTMPCCAYVGLVSSRYWLISATMSSKSRLISVLDTLLKNTRNCSSLTM